jgi:hypothetical protein
MSYSGITARNAVVVVCHAWDVPGKGVTEAKCSLFIAFFTEVRLDWAS